MEDERVFKVILLGETAAGKTSLTTVGVKGEEMDEKVSPTLCSEFASLRLKRPDWKEGEPDEYIRVQIWDTAGQERYHSLSKCHYRGANGALLVFDVSSEASFNEIHPNGWLETLQRDANPQELLSVMLVENKIDMIEAGKRPASFVQEEQVRSFLHSVRRNPLEENTNRVDNSLLYARTSAKTNESELYLPCQNSNGTKFMYQQNPSVRQVEDVLEAFVFAMYAKSRKQAKEKTTIRLDAKVAAKSAKSRGCC